MYPNTLAIYREFPFLEKYFPKKEEIAMARVSRINEEFMNQRSGILNSDPGEPDSISSFGKIFLFDKNGDSLVQVGILKFTKKIFFGRFTFRKEIVESVGQALARLGPNAPVYYAAWLTNDRELIVYKPPKDFTIQGWYKELIRRSQQSVRDSFRTIDNEAIVRQRSN